jgi:ParB family chromosome partitioning protein
MTQLGSPVGSRGLGQPDLFTEIAVTPGGPPTVPIDRLNEHRDNPRAEFPANEIEELAADIAQRGVLQPIVDEEVGSGSRCRIRFGAKRFRAARQAGLKEVPVCIAQRSRDAYEQVAENLKRHPLTPLGMARFIRSRVAAGESNTVIAKHLAIDQTTVAYHLSLLSLPPVLEEALASGRCKSPRTLHELSKLHEQVPAEVAELVSSDLPITRESVGAIREAAPAAVGSVASLGTSRNHATASLRSLAQTRALCERLDASITHLLKMEPGVLAADDLTLLRQRMTDMAHRLG